MEGFFVLVIVVIAVIVFTNVFGLSPPASLCLTSPKSFVLGRESVSYKHLRFSEA